MKLRFRTHALLLSALVTANMAAQVITATVTGTVSDVSGAVIPNANILITDIKTNVRHRVTSDSAGHYTIPYLQPSSYSVVVSSIGFKEFREQPVLLSTAATVRIDAILEVGNNAEVVSVTADAGLLQTETGDVSSIISKTAVQELPLPNRNYQNLVALLPGVTPPNPNSTALQNPAGALTFYNNGQAPSSNSSIVDGIDNTEPLIGIVVQIPSAEVIDEVHVETASYTAEFGRAGGAIVTSTSRAGTNEYHGSFYGFYQGAGLRARNYFNFVGQPKANLVYNQDGATFGGPIKHEKSFFFLSFLGSFQSKSTTTVATVAPTAWRKGDFSGVSGLSLYNPNTGNHDGSGRAKYAGNIINPLTFSSVAAAILPYVPQAQTSALANNYTANVPFSNRGTAYDGRYDEYWSEHLKSFLKYNLSTFDIYNPGVLGPVVGDSESATVRTQTAVLSNVYAPSAKLLAELRIGYNRYATNVTPTTNTRLNAQFGISDPNPNSLSDLGMARIAINGMTAMGAAVTYPVINTDNIFDFINSWTKLLHSHTLKWGVEARVLRLDRYQATGLSYGPRGLFTFNPSTTGLKGTAIPSGSTFANSFAAFLLGASDLTSRTFLTATPTNRQKNFFAYVQDNWQATKKLSLNVGLRWEFYTPITPSKPGGASNYDPATNNLLVAGIGSVGMSTGVQNDYKDFAPRLGAAYRFTNKLVGRIGYGISYYTGTNGYTGGTLSTQYPVVSNVQIGTANDYIVDGSLSSLPAVTAVPIPANGFINPAPAQGLYAVPFRNPFPFVQSMNLTLQQELTPTTSFQVGFVGTVGRRLPLALELNSAPPGTGNTGRALYAFRGTQSTTQRGYTGMSDYESLQASLNQRLWHGVQALVSYTWSKTREGGNVVQNTNLARNYGLSTGDRTHMLSVSHLAHLPFGKDGRYFQSGVGSKLLGGWQLNGILMLDSGTPFTVTADATTCNCPGNGQFANQLKPASYLRGVGSGLTWFDTSAFAAPASNAYGNAGVGSVRGPGLESYNFSVFRNFAFEDRYKAEFRATAYNLTNTPQFANPTASFSSNSFGQISSTLNSVGERQLEFGLRILY
jgi:hypothetical protein